MCIVYAARSNEVESLNVLCPETRNLIQQGKSLLRSKNNTTKKLESLNTNCLIVLTRFERPR